MDQPEIWVGKNMGWIELGHRVAYFLHNLNYFLLFIFPLKVKFL